MLIMMSYGTEYPFGQLGSVAPDVSPPNFLCTPTYLQVGWCEKQKRPWLCVSTAHQQQKHPCVINTVFSTNPEHGPILATMKTINSIPAKASTPTVTVFDRLRS